MLFLIPRLRRTDSKFILKIFHSFMFIFGVSLVQVYLNKVELSDYLWKKATSISAGGVTNKPLETKRKEANDWASR